MSREQRFQQILTIVGGFLMPLGLAVIGIGWYGTAHTGYVFEQIPYMVSGGLLGLGLTFSGALIFFSSWLARLVQLQREQAALTAQLIKQLSTTDSSAAPIRRDTEILPIRERVR
ncbi:hypothetical protein [Catelliglobosispora koreensis]|uniref:hypothetical protein n=1 Tax=Catelliglobosispora koreensis TaxID=129052 RepID=UPI00037CDF6E|nr:hypothetical protein [Catelliglobosispora koreensis]